MSKQIPIKFAISQEFVCSYLPNEQEQLLIAIDDIVYTPHNYQHLIEAGFRRSGQQVYRPHCQHCQACQSIRVPVNDFNCSRSQKRLLKKTKHFDVIFNNYDRSPDKYFPLYEKYINERHQDGSMYPASYEQYIKFVMANWLETAFLEIYDQEHLISVCVLDQLPESLSAVYTFFDPAYEQFSLGSLSILKAIEFAEAMNNQYVYLGYQVDACKKMNYKTKFKPYQRLINNQWQTSTE